MYINQQLVESYRFLNINEADVFVLFVYSWLNFRYYFNAVSLPAFNRLFQEIE